MKTLIYSSHNFEKPFIEKAAQGKQDVIFTQKVLSIDTENLSMGFEAVALFTSDDASAGVLKRLFANGIKFITLRSVGHDHVDLKKAKELGIKVANVPSYSPYSIAEHSVALLLALNRNITQGQQLIQKSNFCLDTLVGFDLHDKTVGIVGTGKIGAAFASIMKGFGCKLLGYDIEINNDLITTTGITYTSLKELCRNSDIVSVHCPLNDSTKHLFDKKIFGIMKKGMFFINTARGSIVNTVDLINALENGTVAAAGLDVYENEKNIFFENHTENPIEDDTFKKLQAFPNVLITGHQAFLTNEALEGIAATTIANLNEFSQKGHSNNDLLQRRNRGMII